MAIRNILIEGEPRLRKKSRMVDKFDAKLALLLDDMKDTMYDANGVGLAAAQIGILKNIVVIDISDGPLELVNPQIIYQYGEQCNCEGCLSVPEVTGYVKRPEKLVVRAQDRNGKMVEHVAEDFLAVAMCHEIDHLSGILFIDKVLKLTDEELSALKKRDEEQDAKQED